MTFTLSRRRAGIVAGVAAALAAAAAAGGPGNGLLSSPERVLPRAAQEKLMPVQGLGGEEAFEARTAAEQFAQARTAPGVVAPGAYSAAYAALTKLPTAGGAWTHVTNKPYNADDGRYRDPASNSGGGAGIVTGRVTGRAASADGKQLYAGGANGGVFRSLDGGKTWTAISDKLPTLSTGDLEIAADGALWLATGEANTGATSYVGTGVYRLTNPATGAFTTAN